MTSLKLGGESRAVLTRLGRAIHATHGIASQDTPPHREEHRHVNWLRDVILGGQDGLVNILGIILGVIAGGGTRVVLLAAGFAAAITESISMGAVGYTSAVSERDYYQAEQAREAAEIDATPEAEQQEIREIYAIATLIGHLIPLLPFVWLPRTTALIVGIVLSALVLFGVGVYSSLTLVGDWRKNGLKMVAIGLGAAAIGFLIGRLFHTGT
jgi:predicted membrane protein (TIGR00267 family)